MLIKIPLVVSLGNIQRTVWRIRIMMSGCEWLKEQNRNMLNRDIETVSLFSYDFCIILIRSKN